MHAEATRDESIRCERRPRSALLLTGTAPGEWSLRWFVNRQTHALPNAGVRCFALSRSCKRCAARLSHAAVHRRVADQVVDVAWGTAMRPGRFPCMDDRAPDEQTLRRQLTAFAQFTTRSLGERNIDSLLMDACLRSRAGLNVTHAKLMEYLPDHDRLLLRAGVGWKEGYVGQYQVPPDIDTPIGHAFALSEPVAISDYTSEKTYRYPDILNDHGCVASLNVPLRTDRGNFGVLEVDHTSSRTFSADDIYFLTGLGNTVAGAVELRRALQAMEAALDEKQLLIREMNHRIKNNLSLVGAMLSLQARRFPEPGIREELGNAVQRIHNLALVHDRLQLFTSSVTQVDAASHFQELCAMLRSLLPVGVALTPRCSGSIPSDCVESLTLIANELVTNAAKYAFEGRDSGEIVLGYRQEGAGWRLYVHDNGCGLPPDHDSRSGKSFGRLLLTTLASRANAEITFTSDSGTRVDVVCGVMS
jgi:two-component sensor histidine kinase